MNMQKLVEISNLIIWNNEKLENKFTNKEIIDFFIKIWFKRDTILAFSYDSTNPIKWLPTFLKDLQDNDELIKTLINLSKVINYYNVNFKTLIQKYIWKENNKDYSNKKRSLWKTIILISLLWLLLF